MAQQSSENKSLVCRLSTPPLGSSDLSFPTRYTRNFRGQFWACLWKQHLSYWRDPSYNLVRILFVIVTSSSLSLVYWKRGTKINTQQDLFSMLGSMYSVGLLTGINISRAVMPVVSMERVVMYREKFAGMYSPWAYSFAQVAIEIPYIFLQTVLFVVIAFPSIGFTWSMTKLLWFLYVIFCTLLFYVYFSMMLIALTPTLLFAQVLASFYDTLSNLFSGYIIPPQHIPGWWIWLYHICPLGWTLNGFFTSQYGDVDKEIVVFGEKKSISSFLEDYYGFYHDRLPWTAVVLLILPILFASLYALLVSKLNFQRR